MDDNVNKDIGRKLKVQIRQVCTVTNYDSRILGLGAWQAGQNDLRSAAKLLISLHIMNQEDPSQNGFVQHFCMVDLELR